MLLFSKNWLLNMIPIVNYSTNTNIQQIRYWHIYIWDVFLSQSVCADFIFANTHIITKLRCNNEMRQSHLSQLTKYFMRYLHNVLNGILSQTTIYMQPFRLWRWFLSTSQKMFQLFNCNALSCGGGNIRVEQFQILQKLIEFTHVLYLNMV